MLSIGHENCLALHEFKMLNLFEPVIQLMQFLPYVDAISTCTHW